MFTPVRVLSQIEIVGGQRYLDKHDEIARSLNPNTQKNWSGQGPAISFSSPAIWYFTHPDEG